VDGNPSLVDFEYVTVFSNTTFTSGIEIRLTETGANTGAYRGDFLVSNYTSELDKVISASVEEGIGIRSTSSTSSVYFITLTDPLNLIEIGDQNFFEDNYFEQVVDWYGHNDVQTWTFNSNATWLTWYENDLTMNGTSDNSHVGTYYVKVNITDGLGYYDEITFNIDVQNVDPIITTTPILSAYEEIEYDLELDSDEEGIGNTSWDLMTWPSWLTFDNVTGRLNGIPGNDDVGDHSVKIVFSDGNGGQDHLNYTITVFDENDPPNITATPVIEVDQDGSYLLTLSAIDMDLTGDDLTWTLHTNASWLTLDTGNDKLVGTPNKFEVGTYWVNFSVSDGRGGNDSRNFTLVVNNVNDPPEWNGDSVIRVDLKGGVLSLLSIDQDIMDIDNTTGELIITSSSANVTYGPNGLEFLIQNKTIETTEDVTITISDGEYTAQFDLHLVIEPSWKISQVNVE
jgi:hypothetical protein